MRGVPVVLLAAAAAVIAAALGVMRGTLLLVLASLIRCPCRSHALCWRPTLGRRPALAVRDVHPPSPPSQHAPTQASRYIKKRTSPHTTVPPPHFPRFICGCSLPAALSQLLSPCCSLPQISTQDIDEPAGALGTNSRRALGPTTARAPAPASRFCSSARHYRTLGCSCAARPCGAFRGTHVQTWRLRQSSGSARAAPPRRA